MFFSLHIQLQPEFPKTVELANRFSQTVSDVRVLITMFPAPTAWNRLIRWNCSLNDTYNQNFHLFSERKSI